MMLQILKKKNGFLLIESFVAVFILAVGIVAAVGMFNMAAHSARTNADQIVAMNLARGQSEFLKSGHPYYVKEVKKSNTSWLDPKLSSKSDGTVIMNNRVFKINTAIVEKVQGELAKAQVTVSWVDSRKQDKEITFVSWFSPR